MQKSSDEHWWPITDDFSLPPGIPSKPKRLQQTIYKLHNPDKPSVVRTNFMTNLKLESVSTLPKQTVTKADVNMVAYDIMERKKDNYIGNRAKPK